MDKVLIKTKYDRNLYIKFLRNNIFKSGSIYFFALAAILSIYLAITNTASAEAGSNTVVIYWSFAIMMTISIPFFTLSKTTSAASRNARERGDSLEIIEITKYKITRFIEGKEGKIVLGWERFDSIYEYNDHFFMYLDKETGLFFAKDTFSEGDAETLRRLAKNNLKPGKKGKIKYFDKMKVKNDK